MPFGRNRESRSREAAGRRNWPEAVPKKMRGRKSPLTRLIDHRNRIGSALAPTTENVENSPFRHGDKQAALVEGVDQRGGDP